MHGFTLTAPVRGDKLSGHVIFGAYIVPIKYVDFYEVNYTAERLQGCKLWGAYVAIYAPSSNPMHRLNLLRKRRVSADHPFATAADAVAQAREAAVKLVEQRQRRYVFHP